MGLFSRIVWKIILWFLNLFKPIFLESVRKTLWLWDQVYLRSTFLQQIFSYRLGLYNFNTTETAEILCQVSGISLETHRTITPDGFEIILHRCSLQQPSSLTPSSLPPVLLVHGLMQDAESFLCGGSTSLVFSLLHAGYDVWIGNNRGTKYSSNHLKYERTKRDYWDYSIDDLALYDVPTMIQHVLHTTQYSQLTYIGFSQGSVQAFISFSLNSLLQTKISLFIALSPALKTTGLSSSFLQFLLQQFPSLTFSLFGRLDMLSCCIFFRQILSKHFFSHIIYTAMNFLFHWSCENISFTRQLELFQYCYSSSSVKCVDHWFQIIQSGSIQNYRPHTSDTSVRGCHSNVDSQNQDKRCVVDSTERSVERDDDENGTDVKYHFRSGQMPQMDCPVALFYGGQDTLIVENIHEVLEDLQASLQYHHCEPSYEHLDMIWADNAHQKIFPKIIEQMKQHPSSMDGHGLGQGGRGQRNGEGFLPNKSLNK
jgi:lysosomal acid lipase/cholesteryl ester hydrolase